MPNLIEIPDESDGSLLITANQLGEKMNRTEGKIDGLSALIHAVVAAVVVTGIGSLIAVFSIVMDQLHFNNTTYREQVISSKEEDQLKRQVESLQKDIESLKLSIPGQALKP